MKTTAPILAVGAITFGNRVILNGRPIDWRVPLATLAACAIFAGAEKLWEPGAVGAAYVALVTSLIVPLDPAVPPPLESVAAWWNTTAPAATSTPRYVWT